MPNERTILCGGLSPGSKRWPGGDPLLLRLSGSDHEITLKIEQISESLAKNIPPRFLDLIEIATYVYCADQAITRGGAGVDVLGENWRRKLRFHVPVRDLEFWRSQAVVGALVDTLSFLSEDEYHFTFQHLKKPPLLQTYFDFGTDAEGKVEEIALFSGGLDSLAGAVQEAVIDKRHVALVMHRSNDKLRKRHDHLTGLLDKAAQTFRPQYFPVAINKIKELGREYTQRSRSFLYACLATTFADLFRLDRIRFFENGVISLNLPLSPQVVGAKATRTTHPRVLRGYAKLMSLIVGRPFAVENPFIWKTKAEIVKLIADAGCGALIPYSTSCTHTWEVTKLRPHCGRCSQCIDRRFAILAAGQEMHDPLEGYAVDLLLDPHDIGEDRTMLSAYVETAQSVSKMNETQFLSNYGAVSRVVRHLPGSADAIGMKVFELYQRHAKAVCGVLTDAIAANSARIFRRELPDACLLRLVCDASTGNGAGPSGNNGSPATPQVLSPDALATRPFVFRRMGAAWVMRFRNREAKLLLPTKGVAYLHLLLSNVGKPQSAVAMAFQVAREPTRFALGNAGPQNDAEARASYRAKFLDLKQELSVARKDNDEAAILRLEEEVRMLALEIKANSWGGHQKNEKDDRERIRKAVTAALRRAILDVAKYDNEFANHLQSPRLLFGANPVYNPNESIDWDLQ